MGGRRRSQAKDTRKSEASKMGKSGNAGAGTMRTASEQVIQLSQAALNPRQLKKNAAAWAMEVGRMGVDGIFAEYAGLRNETNAHLRFDAFERAPADRKRYKSVVVWDHSRVPLRLRSADDDFIHANYVGGPGRDKKWIICQGPLSNTVRDFWEMVYQEQMGVIVMLCLVNEPGDDGRPKEKCVQYWKEEAGAKMDVSPQLCVVTERSWLDKPVVEGQEIKVTALWLKKGLNRRRIFHFQYTTWGDQDVPRSFNAMVHFQALVKGKQREMIQENKIPISSPMLVHCSAGVGRSGTFVCIDNAVTTLTGTAGANFSVRDIAAKLRTERFQAVQTERQYLYIYQTLIEHLKAKKFLPPSTPIPAVPESPKAAPKSNFQVSVFM